MVKSYTSPGNMDKEELELLADLEEEAAEALSQCPGYDCIEYDNGTFECDDCPFYMSYCELQLKANKMINSNG